MNIVVTGSLGHISKPITLKLVGEGHQVTVISSNPDREKDISWLGARAAIGSVKDVEFLAETFSGADLVYAMVPPDYQVPDVVEYYKLVGRAYCEALTRAKVKRVILLSSFGADLDAGTGVILGSHHMETMFNDLRQTEVLFIRPGSFFYNLLSFIPVIRQTGMMIGNYGGDDKVPMVAPADIADAVVEEMIRPSGNKIRYVMSDERTCNEFAAVLGKAIGKPDLRWITITDKEMQSNLEAAGLPASVAAKVTETYSALHSGLLASDYRRSAPIKMGKVRIEDYAKEFAAAWMAS